MRQIGGSLNSTFYIVPLSKIHVAYGEVILNLQEQSQESSSILNITSILIDFIVFIYYGQNYE